MGYPGVSCPPFAVTAFAVTGLRRLRHPTGHPERPNERAARAGTGNVTPAGPVPGSTTGSAGSAKR